MRTNSPIDDATPYQVPETKLEQRKASDFARLGRSRDYKEVTKYLESRKEYYRRFLPGGVPVEEIANMKDAELGIWWKAASTIITEIEMLQGIIQREKDESKRL